MKRLSVLLTVFLMQSVILASTLTITPDETSDGTITSIKLFMGETIDLGPESGYNNNAGYKDIYSITIDGAYGPFTLSPDRFGNNDYDSSMSTDELMAIFRSEYPGYDLSIVETLMNDRNSWQLYHDGCAATQIFAGNSSAILDVLAFNEAYDGSPESCLTFTQLFSGSHTMMYIDNYVSTEVGYNYSGLGFGGLWEFTDGGSNGDDGADDGGDGGELNCVEFPWTSDYLYLVEDINSFDSCNEIANTQNLSFNGCYEYSEEFCLPAGCYTDSYSGNYLYISEDNQCSDFSCNSWVCPDFPENNLADQFTSAQDCIANVGCAAECVCYETWFIECPSGYYDCAGECDGSAVVDCAGECGGFAVEDDCGECNGDNSTCSDDCGVPNGDNYCQDNNLDGLQSASEDHIAKTIEFNNMLKSGDIQFTNNVNSRNLLDCHNCFGGQELSVGDRVEVSATGFEFAGLYAGMQGTVLGLTGFPEWDIYGLEDWILVQWDDYENGWWGGTPECGSNPTDCQGNEYENNGAEGCNNTSFWNIACAYTTLLEDDQDCFVVGPDAGCDGVCFSGAEEDCAGECGGSTVVDCAGECGGSAVEDCEGECGGSAVEDECGECNGDNSTCTDECGILNGNNVCAGPNDSLEITFSDGGYYYGHSQNSINSIKVDFNGDSYAVSEEDSQSGYYVVARSISSVIVSTTDGDYTFINDGSRSALSLNSDNELPEWVNTTASRDLTWTMYSSIDASYIYTPLFAAGFLIMGGDPYAFDTDFSFTDTYAADAYGNFGTCCVSGIGVYSEGSENTEEDCFVVGPDAGCDGVCFSGAEEDCTGECSGSTVVDCAGECGGSAVEDCAGVCGGDAVVGGCDNACGSNAVVDCAGECGGSAVVDCTGECGGSVVVDCTGECGGSVFEDECGECGGDNSTCIDECGVPNGGNVCSDDVSTMIVDITAHHQSVYFVESVSLEFAGEAYTIDEDLYNSYYTTARDVASMTVTFIDGGTLTYDCIDDLRTPITTNQDLPDWAPSVSNRDSNCMLRGGIFDMFLNMATVNGNVSVGWYTGGAGDLVSGFPFADFYFYDSILGISDCCASGITTITNVEEVECFVVGPDAGCDGVCFSGVEEDCAGECGGSATEDCAGECGGSTVEDECGECGGDNSTCTDECGIIGGENYCDNPYVGDWSVNLGTLDANGECSIYDYSYYYDYYGYNHSPGIFNINPDGTFTHSFCNGDEVGSWTSNGDNIDITLVCSDSETNSSETYSFLGALVDGELSGTYMFDTYNNYVWCWEATPIDEPVSITQTHDLNGQELDLVQSFTFTPEVNMDSFQSVSEELYHSAVDLNNRFAAAEIAFENDGSARYVLDCTNCFDSQEVWVGDRVTLMGDFGEIGLSAGAQGTVYGLQDFAYITGADEDPWLLVQWDDYNDGIWGGLPHCGINPNCDYAAQTCDYSDTTMYFIPCTYLTLGDVEEEDCFVVGPDAGCDGVCFSEVSLDNCGECGGDNSTCEDCAGIIGGGAVEDDCGVCNGNSSSYDNYDVTIIVMAVDAILNDLWTSDNLYCSDANNDGALDVMDIVVMVESILGSARLSDASYLTIERSINSLSFTSDGFVGGMQLILSHDDDFEIELTKNSMVSAYRTTGKSTTIIIAAPEEGQIFTASSHFVIEDVMAATSSGHIDVLMPIEFGLSNAYPNPFNPSTSFTISMSSTEMVSIDIYNIMGQLVDTIHKGELSAGVHSFSWNGAEIASGAYFIRATTASNVATQKVLLMK